MSSTEPAQTAPVFFMAAWKPPTLENKSRKRFGCWASFAATDALNCDAHAVRASAALCWRLLSWCPLAAAVIAATMQLAAECRASFKLIFCSLLIVSGIVPAWNAPQGKRKRYSAIHCPLYWANRITAFTPSCSNGCFPWLVTLFDSDAGTVEVGVASFAFVVRETDRPDMTYPFGFRHVVRNSTRSKNVGRQAATLSA